MADAGEWGGSMKIKLHIERLVLDGLPIARTQGGKVRAAVEQELTRLLATGGVSHELRPGGAMPSLRGGRMRLQKGISATEMGQEIARSVHQRIGTQRYA